MSIQFSGATSIKLGLRMPSFKNSSAKSFLKPIPVFPLIFIFVLFRKKSHPQQQMGSQLKQPLNYLGFFFSPHLPSPHLPSLAFFSPHFASLAFLSPLASFAGAAFLSSAFFSPQANS